MADKKISALTAAATPLAGSEVLPIVQSGSTVKVSVDNLTYGKTVTVQSLKLEKVGTFAGSGFLNANQFVSLAVNNGSVDQFYINQSASQGALEITSDSNLKVLSGKGIDFSANTHAPGMTSELLDWYEEGAFTPVIEGSSTAGTASYAAQAAKYTRNGNTVYFEIYLVWSGGTGTGELRVAGLPFASSAGAPFGGVSAPVFTGVTLTALNYLTGAYVLSSDTKMRFFQSPVGGGAGTAVSYSASGECMLTGFYFV